MSPRPDLAPRRPVLAAAFGLGLAASVAACGNGCATANDDSAPSPKSAEEILAGLEVPDGFRIEVFAPDVEGARSLARGDQGTIFVGSRGAGMVHALVDTDDDGRAETRYVVARGLNSPNGVAFRDGALYVAEISKVWRFDDIESQLDDPPDPVLVSDDYPTDAHHGWKYIDFGPDGWLYVPVGAPCNVCDEDDEVYASITRMRPDGSGREVYARGVRNSVGFDWDPQTGELWFTDNGRDNLGDDRPTDELNHAPRAGLHFGFPYCHQGDILDPEFGAAADDGCDAYEPPAQKLGPHVAALGMTFYEGDMFPPEYRGQIFIPEHGSWNRTDPIGYRVTLVRRDSQGRPLSYEPFIEGWLRDGEGVGRPVDLLELPDGSLLLSDDHASMVYRITYAG